MNRTLRRTALVALSLSSAGLPAVADAPLPLEIGGDFVLTDHDGTRRDSRDFRGRPMLVYFGYTSCPHSCGMALSTISAALDGLGSRAPGVAALLVTVDPVHDTPARLAAFLDNFHPAVIGLTGDEREIRRVRDDFRAGAVRVAESGRFARLYEHSVFIYLIGPDGELESILPPIVPPARLAALLRARLDRRATGSERPAAR